MSNTDLFKFNKREKRGLIVLTIILICVLVFPLFQDVIFPGKKYDEELLIKEIEKFQKSLIQKEESENNQVKQIKQSENDKKKISIKLKSIDVNSSTIQNWLDLGFSKKQAKVIMKYLDKAKPLNNVEELKKIYIIDDDKYNEIIQYLYIENKTDTLELENIEPEKITIEINTADTGEFREIGIPGYIAARIIKYRDLLGGYHSFVQLNEVYGMNKKYLEILEAQNLDTTSLSEIDLNNNSFKEINKHPYIDYETTKKIFNYLKVMDTIKNIEELERNNIVSEEQLIKLNPYLIF